jgi:hypothetical protein
MLVNVKQQADEWKMIRFQLSTAANKIVAFSVDAGWGG